MKNIRYLSVCSGMEAASVAWGPLGFEAVGFSEIDPFPSAILAHRFPHIKNYGDLTKYQSWDIPAGTIDILVGGTPCQSFSVAGLRRGLEDPRGNLALTFIGLADKVRPRWIVWENVPGVLSSNRGLDFGSFIGALGELGYGYAWRVLDAQYFGVPQRRRRVFLVATDTGDCRRAAEVLSLPEGLHGYIEEGKKKREAAAEGAGGGSAEDGWPHDVTGTLDASFGTKHGQEDQHVKNGCPFFVPGIVDCTPDGISGTVTNKWWRGNGGHAGAEHYNLTVIDRAAFNQGENAQYNPIIEESDIAPTLPARSPHAIAYRKSRRATSSTDYETWVDDGIANTLNLFDCSEQRTTHAIVENPLPMTFKVRTQGVCNGEKGGEATFATGGAGALWQEDKTYTINTHRDQYLKDNMSVRRLTPRECERLQGFPDDWSMIPWRGKPASECPDTPRYKAIGNSMAVPVMAWIGRRIQLIDNGNI